MAEMMTPIMRRLTYAGIAPFVIALLIKWEVLAPFVEADLMLWGYATVIAAFMAGSHWGAAIRSGDPVVLLASNGFALAVFALAVWMRTPIGVIFLAIIFAAQLLLDRRLQMQAQLTAPYWRMRVIVAAMVCAILLSYAMI